MSTSREERSYHHGDLRMALLRAAAELLAEQGEAAISLREVARRAQVSHNAPYRHFTDREALLAALAEQGFAELLERMQVVAREGKAEARLAALGRCYVDFALQRRGLFRLMFSGALERNRYPALLTAAQALHRQLEEAVAVLVADVDGIASLSAWSLVHGLAQLLLEGQVAVDEGRQVLIERVTSEFAEGLLRRG
ncbi:TetR/AcrR family transcriptional regulator [Pseudomonas alcaligenes]|uniref:TetR/AcrR family transcriptional regulator n=1 Tax=Aquipseudomonas alcaligenes TaxID=43263 RepID=UPI00358F379A